MATLRDLRGSRWRQPKGGVPGRGDLDEELERRSAEATRKQRLETRKSLAESDTLGIGVTSVFSPHLEKIPHFYVAPKPKNLPAGIAFRDKPGAVARLLIEAYKGSGKEVELAARLARRVVEMLEHELHSPKSDLFIDAAATGQIDKLKSMLSNGQSVDAQHTGTGYTALHAAAMYGQLKVAKFLVKRGADIHCEEKGTRNTPLHMAAENGQAALVTFLVREAGIDKLRKNSYGLMAYDLACENSHDLIMDTLREPPARIDTISLRGIPETRSLTIEWDIPDDHGVRIIEYEVSWLPIGGVEAALYPDRGEVVKTALICATDFGPNPHAERRALALQACFEKKAAKEAKLLRQKRRLERAQSKSRLSLSSSFGSRSGFPDDENDDDVDDDSSSDEEDGDAEGPDESVTEIKGDGNRNHNVSRSQKTDVESSWAHARVLYSFDKTLMPSTEYGISVRARSVAGWGAVGERLRVTTAADVPDAPGKAKISETGATCVSIDLEWPAPHCNNGFVVDTYELQARRAADGEECYYSVSEKIVGSTQGVVNAKSGNRRVYNEFRIVKYTADRLESDTSYIFRIRARNKIGASKFGPESQPMSTRPPARGIFATSCELGVDWSESIDEKMRQRGIVRWELQRTVPPTARSGAKTNPGAKTIIREPATEESGNASMKEAMPTDASTSEVLDEEDVEELEDDGAYDWRKAPWETVTTQVVGDEHSFIVRDLAPATMYYIRVRPTFRDENCASLPWNECPVSIGLMTDMAVPNEPLAPIVSRGKEFDVELTDVWHDSVRITWRVPRDNGNPIDKFHIRCADVVLGTWRSIFPSQVNYAPELSADPGYESQVVRGLDPGCSYRFAVRAHNEMGWGSFSSPGQPIATRPSEPPQVPHLISRTDSVVRLEWEPLFSVRSGIEIRYEVQVKVVEDLDNRSFNLANDCLEPLAEWITPKSGRDLAENVVSITDLQPVTGYHFRVRASINGIWSNFSLASQVYRTTRRF